MDYSYTLPRIAIRCCLALFLMLSTFQFASAQCECPNNNVFKQHFSSNQIACASSFTTASIGPGQYTTVFVYTGVNYSFNLCGGSGWNDKELSGWNHTSGTCAFFEDDGQTTRTGCGSLDAGVTWTATFTGRLRLAAERYHCNNWRAGVGSATLSFRENLGARPPRPNGATSCATGSSHTLTRSGTPPAGYRWYWQTSASGTSTALGSGSSISVTGNGTRYLRPRSVTGAGCWGPASLGATVTFDATRPTARCRNVTVNLNASGNASVTAAQVNNNSTDNCTVNSLAVSPSAFTCANKGNNTVTLTVRDANNNSRTCTATVTVRDVTNPSISCPSNITRNAANGACAATVTYATPSGSDNCPGFSVTRIAGPASGSSFPVGSTTVTHRVTDGAGRTATCSFTVTVVDNQNPSISCPSNISINASNGACARTVNYSAPTASDNCPGVSLTRISGPASGSSFSVGTSTITYRATDASGRTSTCSFTVTVVDNQNPSISCPSSITTNAGNGTCARTVSYTVPTASDNCPGVTVTRTSGLASGASFPVGTTLVTYRATDGAGRTASCSFTVTVVDNQNPSISCPSNITTNAANGTCARNVTYTMPTGSDNCPGVSVTRIGGPASGSSFPVGTTTVTHRATDASGRTATCSFIVTVVDNQNPTISCPSNISVNAAPGQCSAAVSYATPTSTDNCPGQSVTLVAGLASGSTFPLGTTTVTHTVTDASGNTASCSFNVTVIDNQNPSISCSSNITVNAANGMCAANVTFSTPTASDNCPGTTVAQTAGPASGSSFPVGITPVTFTATDGAGNTSSCSFNITVVDNQNPTAVCQNITVQLNSSGNASISASDVNGGSSDNCMLGTPSVSPNNFGCAAVGVNTVILTVPDVGGNISTCNAIVVVEDNVAPNAQCQPVAVVQLDAGGNASVSVSDVNNGSSDACGISTMNVSPNAFTCSDAGPNTVTLTVTDNNGNTASCNTTVVVEDNIPPAASCQSITVFLDVSGSASINGPDLDGGSTDNCGIASLSASPSSFGCSDVGNNNVTLTVSDVNGNSSTCTSVVAVQDTFRPVATCQNITVALNASGMATITANDVDAGSNDACATFLSISQTSFNCSDLGPNNVILTASDGNGNTSTCVSIVTITDPLIVCCAAPVANCRNVTVQLSASGNASITVSDVNNGSTAACGMQSITASPLSFTCANLGANSVTLTVTDVNNTAVTCTATVMVQDNIAPLAACQNITIQLNASGNATITGNDIDGGSTDNCTISSRIASTTAFSCSDVGSNPVTLTVSDASGNSNACAGTVTVEDNVAPVATCQNVTVQLNSSGNASIVASNIDGGSSDACGIASLSATPTAFNCSNFGTNTSTLTVTDNNGNTSTCTATVVVKEEVDPIAVCQNITVQLSASGNASIVASDINNGSSDNCGIGSMNVSPTNFNCTNVGGNTVTLNVIDIHGNNASCNATVFVQDNVAPMATCQNITVQLNSSGNASITGADINNGSSDACGIATMSASPSSFTCADIGANTVTLTVTDNNGNASTCTATVTVEDNVAPMAICQNITVQLSASGNASIVASDVDGGASDACGIASLSVTPTSFNCSNIGSNTVTLTVTDNNSNVSSCTATVTIEDNVAPVAVCQNITVQLSASGNASIVASDIDGGSTDNCGIASLSASPTSFTCADVGANSVTLTVTDNDGNSATCSATVTVEDNVAPMAVCQNITVQLNASGNASISASDVDGGSSDACGIAGLSATPTSFTCANVGANTVTLTVTDNNGNTASCTATATVEDNVAPMAVCQNITVQLSASGNASITASDVDGGSSDACGIASLSATPTSFNCANVGANTVTLTVTDNNGNVSTCTATVTIEDNVPPVALCQNITVQLNSSGNASITASDIDGGSSDNCGIASMSASPGSFTCADIGTNTVTLTVTDNNGNTANCTSTVTVEDNVAPLAVCQNLTVQLDGSGNASITASDVDGGSTDACGIASLSATPTSFTCADVGANTVTLTVTDNNSNVSTCTATVTVEDNIAPMAVCQNITIQLSASGNASIAASDIDGGSSDACGIASLSATPTSFTCANVGANTVTLTVTDNNGNTANCTATVTVEDLVAPMAVCQNITVQLDANGNASITASDVDGGSSDNCGIASLSVTPSSFTCADVGANTATLTVTDNNGNTATCTATVTVEDNVAPMAVCQNITVQLDGSGNASITASDVDGGSTDACGIASLSATPTTFNCANVGANTVTLTVTDNNGNVGTCSATVTIEDTVPPIAVCQNITVQLSASGNASITASDIDGGSSDNCGIASLSATPTSFTCANVGANMVTLTVTDNNGNTATCTAMVTVEDTIAPMAVCQNITVQLDGSGNASIVAADIDGGSSDNCGIASLSASPTSFTCANVGANMVSLTVTDNNGNTATCTAMVTVEDTVPPVAVCQSITVQLSASGNASITASDVDGGSNDACGIASISATPTSFTCANVGANTVTLTVTDNNSNVSTCTATVTVEDTVPPMAVCQNITVQLSASGNASITASDIDGGSSDNCGIAGLSATPTSFTCANVGANMVTLTVTDNNGNTATCTAMVTVEDSVPPMAVCQNITVQLDGSGNASITASDVDGGSSDACGIAGLSATPTSFTCTNVGANTVTLTVTDNNSNVSTCTSTVTIEDTVPPMAVCQSITVQLSASGNASIVASDVDGGSSDACGIASISATPTSFTCTNVGANTVTLTVTDNNSNVATCTATVTVEDTVPPVALCQNLTIQLSASGNAAIVAADVNNGSNDACGIAGMMVSPSTFTCANVGANTVTLTVTDVNSNTATCTATVTVEDTVPPVAVCQNITVQLSASGNASIVPADVDGGSNDACGINNLSIDVSSFTCANVGANTVTLTVTDNNSNVSSCTSTVTVEDTVPPMAICQNITVQLSASGNAGIVPADVDGGSNDACGIANLSIDINTFTCANVGANTVTLTVTDNNSNVSTCTATVTIEDTVPPVAICQNITVQLDALGNAAITAADVDNGSNDACGIAGLSVTPTAFTCTNVGPNTVTFTVSDNNGNTATCTATVTVEDTIPPVAVCQSITVQLSASGNASIVPADVDGGSNDACGIANLSIDISSFTCANVGANTVTLTVTDNNSNVSTCTATVTIEDTVPPVALCQSITIQLSASGNASITANDIDNGSNDACGIDSLSLTPSAFTCANVGLNTVTLTATDNNGNTATCTATVTVEDTVPPIALCQNATVYLDASGSVNVSPILVDAGSNDACGIDSLSVSPGSFGCANVGTNTVTLTAYDLNGNTASCTATVMVEDTVQPVALCQNILVQLSASGNASIVPSDVDAGSSDACGIDSLSIDISSFTCTNVGSNMVTLSVTDNNSNVTTCTAIVTIEDTVPPLAVCQNITVQLDASGAASIVASDVDGGSSDACSIATLAATPTSFTCTEVGANNVTLTVTDVNNNMSTCTAIVTVEDTVPPVAVCQNITIQLDTAGVATILDADLDGGSTDACGIDTVVAAQTVYGCADVGTNMIVLTVTDVNGNVSTCTANVTVNPSALTSTIASPLVGCGYNIACNGDSSGTITVNPVGGCPVYTYNWSNGGTTQTLSGVPAGSYSVTITDGLGAMVTDTITLTEPSIIQNAAQVSSWVCMGDSTGMIDLTTVGGHDCAPYSYVWSNGATTEDIFNLPAGTYTVTVTDTMGCTRVDNITLTLNPLPSINLGPDVQKCAENMVTLNAGSSFANYTWSTGAITPTISVMQPGVYWVEVVDPFGCHNRDSILVSDYMVNDSIITPLGSTTLCQGDSIELMGDAGLQNYLWSTGATTQNITLVDTGGIYTLFGHDANGCEVNDTLEIIYQPFTGPVPMITPGPAATVCENDSLTLDAGSGYAGYSWSNGATTQTIQVAGNGNYNVTVSNASGCTAVSDTVNVTMTPAPNPPISSSNDSLFSVNAYASYQWNRGGAVIPGATMNVYVPQASGWFTLTVSDTSGCTGTSQDSIFIEPVAIEDELQEIYGLTLFPNPSNGLIKIRTLSPIDWNVTVTITNMFGQKLREYQMAHLISDASFDLRDLANGMYLMEIVTEKGEKSVLRFMIE